MGKMPQIPVRLMKLMKAAGFIQLAIAVSPIPLHFKLAS
jgi:hypothetical protein